MRTRTHTHTHTHSQGVWPDSLIIMTVETQLNIIITRMLQQLAKMEKVIKNLSSDIEVIKSEMKDQTVIQKNKEKVMQQTIKELDGVPRTQTSRLLLCYYSSRSHGTVCR